MHYEKSEKDTYYGLPLEYRIEKRRDKDGVHDTLILAFRGERGGALNYEHPPRRVKNWDIWKEEYQTYLREHPDEPSMTFLEYLPEERIMQDFCEGLAGTKQNRRRKRNG